MSSPNKESVFAFRCTEGEASCFEDNRSRLGLSKHDYIVQSVLEPSGRAPAIDYAIIKEFLTQYAGYGKAVNEIARDMNTLAILVAVNSSSGTMLRVTLDNVRRNLFDVKPECSLLRRSLDAFSRACSVEVDTPMAMNKPKPVRICARMTDDDLARIRARARELGTSMTNLVLAKCVYRESQPVFASRELLETIDGECSSQNNNASQMVAAVGKVNEQAWASGSVSPLTDGDVTSITSVARDTKFVAARVRGCTTPLFRASLLQRYL